MVQTQYVSNTDHIATCGDNIVQSDETCDDGNIVAQDGCSASCTLEEGYMCYSSVRRGDNNALGNMVANAPSQTHGWNLTVLAKEETCGRGDICQYGSMWQPELWAAVYADGTTDMVLPPSGYYCTRFCHETFIPPPGHEFLHDCAPTPVNECIRGLTTCDSNAYCLEPEHGIGYSCRCDENFFVSAASGTGCVKSGVELVVNVTGGIRTSDVNFDTVDKANILQARNVLIEKLFELNYIKEDKSSLALVLEGVLDYPLELVEPTMTSDEFVGRSMWRIILRIPSEHIDVALFTSGALLHQYAVFSEIFTPSNKHLLHSAQQCSNDREQTCVQDQECLQGGSCAHWPDAKIRLLSSGGNTAPLSLKASGSRIMSAEYNVVNAGFDVRIRYIGVVFMCTSTCMHASQAFSLYVPPSNLITPCGYTQHACTILMKRSIGILPHL